MKIYFLFIAIFCYIVLSTHLFLEMQAFPQLFKPWSKEIKEMDKEGFEEE